MPFSFNTTGSVPFAFITDFAAGGTASPGFLLSAFPFADAQPATTRPNSKTDMSLFHVFKHFIKDLLLLKPYTRLPLLKAGFIVFAIISFPILISRPGSW
jgi:hypothetical protein